MSWVCHICNKTVGAIIFDGVFDFCVDCNSKLQQVALGRVIEHDPLVPDNKRPCDCPLHGPEGVLAVGCKRGHK